MPERDNTCPLLQPSNCFISQQPFPFRNGVPAAPTPVPVGSGTLLISGPLRVWHERCFGKHLVGRRGHRATWRGQLMYLTIAYLLVMSQYCRCLLAAAFFATRTPPPSPEAWRPSE